MKVKVINRNEEQCTKQRNGDIVKMHRNLDPALHPFDKATEYTRALNAAKLGRVFAKPFLAAFTHDDAVTCLARNTQRLNSILSGAADGVIALWDVAGNRCLRRYVCLAVTRLVMEHMRQVCRTHCGCACTGRRPPRGPLCECLH